MWGHHPLHPYSAGAEPGHASHGNLCARKGALHHWWESSCAQWAVLSETALALPACVALRG